MRQNGFNRTVELAPLQQEAEATKQLILEVRREAEEAKTTTTTTYYNNDCPRNSPRPTSSGGCQTGGSKASAYPGKGSEGIIACGGGRQTRSGTDPG
jgi:hypothetical protein